MRRGHRCRLGLQLLTSELTATKGRSRSLWSDLLRTFVIVRRGIVVNGFKLSSEFFFTFASCLNLCTTLS